MFELRQIYLSCCLLLCFSGCHLGPNYKPIAVDTPSDWKSPSTVSKTGPCLGFWWELFDDCILDWLEEQAIVNNPSLYAALDRVAQARAMAGIDRAALYPHVNLTPSFNDTGVLFKIFVPPGLFPPTDATDLSSPFRIHQQQYNLLVNLSYELDLWGKLSGQYNSALYSAEAQMEDFNNSLLTLTADVAAYYFQARALDAQIQATQNNLELISQNLTLVQSRFQKGLISELDVVSAQQVYSDAEANFYSLVQQRVLQENALATLIGMAPSEFHLDANPLWNEPPAVPAGLPSEVLMQRPDIAAAERTMASQHALIGVAYAYFFPSISLTGALGSSSPDFKDFLTWKNRYWSIGSNALQTLFDAGRNLSNLDLAYAQYKESANNYRQTVLTAFHEVEDALAALEWESKQYQSYAQSAQAADKRVKLSTNRYKQGLVNYLDVIDSERTALQADINRFNVLGMRYISTIQLIKAIGGSWSTGSFEPAAEEPRSSCESEDSQESHRPDIIQSDI